MSKPIPKNNRILRSQQVLNALIAVVRPNLPLDLQNTRITAERLTAIFDSPLTKAQAQTQIQRWAKKVRASGLHCFDQFLQLWDAWLDEITNYFVEGFNNKVKVLKRRCYGIFNLAHLFQRIYFDLLG